jgi:hypothetical protein
MRGKDFAGQRLGRIPIVGEQPACFHPFQERIDFMRDRLIDGLRMENYGGKQGREQNKKEERLGLRGRPRYE